MTFISIRVVSFVCASFRFFPSDYLVLFILTQTWFDEFVRWDPAEYDNSEIAWIPSNVLWVPDIVINNK